MSTPQRPVPPPRPRDELPAGYRIAESGVPDVPPKYQVLHGRGRDEQFIGMRESREEATQLAFQHHGRVAAERAAAMTRPVTPTHGPRR